MSFPTGQSYRGLGDPSVMSMEKTLRSFLSFVDPHVPEGRLRKLWGTHRG